MSLPLPVFLGLHSRSEQKDRKEENLHLGCSAGSLGEGLEGEAVLDLHSTAGTQKRTEQRLGKTVRGQALASAELAELVTAGVTKCKREQLTGNEPRNCDFCPEVPHHSFTSHCPLTSQESQSQGYLSLSLVRPILVQSTP